MEDKKNNYILITLGTIALFADLIAVGQFILSGLIFKFWSFNWIVTVNFIFLLLAIGFYLFYIGSENDIFDAVLITFGVVYVILSIALYLYFGYSQIKLLNSKSDFFAYLALLYILCFISFSLIYTQSNRTVLIASYGYGVAGLIYILMLGYKYIFLMQNFSFTTFIGEVIIGGIGALLFYLPYSIAVGKRERPQYIMKYYQNGN